MLFHQFQTQDERRAFGGSTFIELQLCRLPAGTSLRRITAVSSIPNWQNDSLYVADIERFFALYGGIFAGAVYNNRRSGPMDLFGINYYPPERLQGIIAAVQTAKPDGYAQLLSWLQGAAKGNGFYILGI